MTKGEAAIRIWMLKKGFSSYEDMAKYCGVTRQFIGMFVSGKRTSDKILGCMADALEISREKILRTIFQKQPVSKSRVVKAN
jgi:transcriptional regulator with XRE-family HTH domain